MKMSVKSLFVTALTLVAASAYAETYGTGTVGDTIDLQECGGTLQITKSDQGSGEQVNLVLKHVAMCSNFDITSANYEDAKYKSQKIDPNGTDGDRSDSKTIPKRFFENGVNTITVEIYSNKKNHHDIIEVKVGNDSGGHKDPVPSGDY